MLCILCTYDADNDIIITGEWCQAVMKDYGLVIKKTVGAGDTDADADTDTSGDGDIAQSGRVDDNTKLFRGRGDIGIGCYMIYLLCMLLIYIILYLQAFNII